MKPVSRETSNIGDSGLALGFSFLQPLWGANKDLGEPKSPFGKFYEPHCPENGHLHMASDSLDNYNQVSPDQRFHCNEVP